VPPTPPDPRLLSTESFHGVSPEVPVKPPRIEPIAPGEAPAIPGYQIVGRLGRGGMGVVYLATRVSDGAELALKTIALGSSAPQRDIQRFLREANILRQLQHPNIVTFHDMGRQGETLYFVMDYVAGTDAGSLLVRQGPMRIGRAVRLVCQALEALHYAHGQGFVHRDVKPANLLVSGEPGSEICKVADFGLARVYHASVLSGITMLGESGGTPDYMPPEQITHYREVRPAADQYAAAATLYRLLTGRHLYDFSGLSPAKRLTKILFDEPTPIHDHRPDVPEPLVQVIHRALEKEPAARFPDAAAFRGALLPFGSHL
jgi:serine/threonine protein kinase